MPGALECWRVPAQVVGPLAREVEALVVDLALDRVGERDPVVLGAVLPARRDLAHELERLAPARALDQPHALVVDHEERGRLRVVGARGGAAGDLEEHRPQLGLAVGLVERAVVHHRAGDARRGDEDRLLQRAQRRRARWALVAQRAVGERLALRDAPRAAVLQRRHERVVEEVAQPGVLVRGPAGRGVVGGGAHQLWRSSSARAVGNTSRSAFSPSQQVEVRVVLEDRVAVELGAVAAAQRVVGALQAGRDEHAVVLAGHEVDRHAGRRRGWRRRRPRRARCGPRPRGSSARCARRT